MDDAVAREAALAYSVDVALKERDKLIDLLGQQDAIAAAVLRVHLVVERQLDRIIEDNLPRPDRFFDGVQLSFAGKLALVDSMDVVHESFVRALRHLNTLRNECVHDLDAVVTRKHMEKIALQLLQCCSAENQAVVAWLRKTAASHHQAVARYQLQASVLEDAAAAIEAGVHREG